MRILGAFGVGLLLFTVMTGMARKFGESMGCEIGYTSAELAASFLAGGLLILIYRKDHRERNKL